LLNELSNVIKATKPKHILKAIISPFHTLKAIKYHYRRVSERVFIIFLARQWGYSNSDIDLGYSDLNRNNTLWENLKIKLATYPNNYGLQMTKELPALYLLIRLIQPNNIVETGVSSGASSAYILRALHDNKKGKLYSIDLPPGNLPINHESGWIVPNNLRNRWSLHIGDAKILLEPLLAEIGELDCFIHDSLHTYEHMLWEYRTVWPYLKTNGLFLSHDIGASEAFFDFMNEKGIAWKSYRVFHVLGGFKKTA